MLESASAVLLKEARVKSEYWLFLLCLFFQLLFPQTLVAASVENLNCKFMIFCYNSLILLIVSRALIVQSKNGCVQSSTYSSANYSRKEFFLCEDWLLDAQICFFGFMIGYLFVCRP